MTLFLTYLSYLSSFLVPDLITLTLFFFNDPATTEIYTLSLHVALPICDDAYTPGNVSGKRPNRAVIAYTAAVKGAFKGLPKIGRAHV